MNDRTNPDRRGRRRSAALAGAGCGLTLVLAGTCWTGCSIEKNYEVLSFFFDGVPDPNARKSALPGAPEFIDLKASPTYSAHKPFVEERCDDCHGGRFRLGRKDSSVCLKCHEKVPSSEERMHGPVAAGACLWCHTPHESAYAKLLKDVPRTLCSECHEPAELDVERVPAHADKAQNCLECHFGHGGTQRFFLRPGSEISPRPAATTKSAEEHP